MTDRERRIVEQSVRESPAGKPSFGMEVILPTVIFTGATWALLAVGSADTQLADRAAAAVCIVALLVLLRIWHGEGRPVHYTEHTRYVEEPPKRERPFVTSSDAQRIKVGKWDFTENEWQELGKVLATGRVSRAALAELENDEGENLFVNITANYNGIVRELKRLGWLTDENEVTDVARGWYHGRGMSMRPTGDGAS